MKRRFSLLASVLATALLSGCGGGAPEVELVNARLDTFTNPEGKTFQTICTEWKNTGGANVTAVKADLKAYDANGAEIYSAPDYHIYASSSGIGPGETYRESGDDGHVILPDIPAVATRVDLRITAVK